MLNIADLQSVRMEVSSAMDNSSAISSSLQSAYDEQYSDIPNEWRYIGAKAKNILQVTKGRDFKGCWNAGQGKAASSNVWTK